ncbi:MAG: hypothetical protein ABJM58_04815 [Alteripontixanthobacter sp.]
MTSQGAMRPTHRRAARARRTSDTEHEGGARWLAAGTIAFLMLFNIALISLEIASIPIRSVLTVGSLGLFAMLWPEIAGRALKRHALVLVLAGLLAALGTFVSLVAGTSPGVIGRAILEVHVQAVVTLIFATIAAEIAGPRLAVFAIVGAVAVTGMVAALQVTGLDPAWDLRAALGSLQGHKLHEDSSFLNRRPMGISYSPIHLATQACLAFAAYGGLRHWQENRAGGPTGIAPDGKLAIALLAMVAVATASATRSPIMGAAVFAGLYLLMRGNVWLAAFALAGGALMLFALPAILEALEGTQYRVLRVDDNSASGRLPLFAFGGLLLLDNPLGYGFGFESTHYWSRYWPELYQMPSAGVIREAELHNYVLNMATTYGLGLVVAAPLIVALILKGRGYLLFFVPYAVHILFHNSGPFWNDTLFWFVVGALSSARLQKAAPRPRPVNRSRMGANV